MRPRRLLALLAAACAACQSVEEPAPVGALAAGGLRAVADPQLHALIETGTRVLSGALPEGDAAFAALAARGVRTIVSVDGARPDAEAAARHGLRYVHVPFGYDGIEPAAAERIVAVMAVTEGGVYFHCHHGKHRGPAAAALALRAETGCSVGEALELMRLAETDPNYEGLWRDAAGELPLLDADALPELPAAAHVADFTAAMAQLDREWDRVKLVRAAAWTAPAAHPDLAPAKEARILAETMAESARLAPADLAADEEFARRMRAAGEDARALADALERGAAPAAEEAFARLKRGCLGCHDQWRN